MDRFPLMANKLLFEEGKYSDDPFDNGGKTIYGISSKNFSNEYVIAKSLYDKGYANLAKEYAINFYQKNFWNPLYDQIKDSTLCYRLFDFGVNAGKSTAVRLLQKAINKHKTIAIDGDFGMITLTAINVISEESYFGANESQLYKDYITLIENYYKSLNKFWRFGKGWISRLKRLFNLKLPLFIIMAFILVGCCGTQQAIHSTEHIILPYDISDTLDYTWLQGFKEGAGQNILLPINKPLKDTVMGSFGYMFGKSSKSSVIVDTIFKKIYIKTKSDTVKIRCIDTIKVTKISNIKPEKHSLLDLTGIGVIGFFIGVILLFTLRKLI